VLKKVLMKGDMESRVEEGTDEGDMESRVEEGTDEGDMESRVEEGTDEGDMESRVEEGVDDGDGKVVQELVIIGRQGCLDPVYPLCLGRINLAFHHP
jgi:hypothetical protein